MAGWLVSLLAILPFGAIAQTEITLSIGDDIDATVTRFDADGDFLVLWLAPEYGFRATHRTLAQRIADQGIEVWQTNLVEALFLTQDTTSQKSLDGSLTADLVDVAYRETGKRVAILADSYAAITALRGVHQWQQRGRKQQHLIGVLLFSPYTYATIPPLGAPPEFAQVIHATNAPVMIFQAERSATSNHLEPLLSALRQHGSPVYTYRLANIMGLFYEEPPTAAIEQAIAPIPNIIRRVLPLLARHRLPRRAEMLTESTDSGSGIDVYLREYQGDIQPQPIRLRDVNDKLVTREHFTGRLTLINFWASWCPPCVEEIPSLNRLRQRMQNRPFDLISINYAEDRPTVADFMQQVQVDFPVLLDLKGQYTRQWNVVSYPSTFVIAPDGTIRYGINAAIEWDSDEVVEKLDALLDEDLKRPRN